MFRFAIMGAGGIAAHFVKAMDVTGASVCAIASKSLSRAQAFAKANGIASAYGDYAQMLEKEKPDAVYIAVTQQDHARLTDLCVSYGIPVLCEKAMFSNGYEADEVFSHAEEAGVFTMEALWSRFLPSTNRVRSWLENGEIGDIALAEFGIGFQAPPDPENRFFNPKLHGGAMYDLTVYGYEILTWLFGENLYIENVAVSIADTGVDASDFIVLRKKNSLFTIRTSLITPIEERMIIYGTRGKIIVPKPHIGGQADLLGPDGEVREHFVDTVTQHGFSYEIEETMRCIREGKLESPIVSHASTLGCAKFFDVMHLN